MRLFPSLKRRRPVAPAAGTLDDFEIVAIDGASEAQTAELLRSFLVFLCFG